MGANMMMRVAGEQGSKTKFKAMVAVNNPFDLWLAISLMRGKVYEKHLAKELRQNLVIRDDKDMNEKERAVYKEMVTKFGLDLKKLGEVDSWRDFDEWFTIKVNPEFKSAAQYYNAASCLFQVTSIECPTLVLHSADDPIVPVDCVPVEECLANKNIICAFTKRGGHVCYFMGTDGKERWYTHATAEYLTNCLKIVNKETDGMKRVSPDADTSTLEKQNLNFNGN